MKIAVAAIACLGFAGCGHHSSAGGGSAPVRVTVRDFRISAPRSLPAGDHRFEVHNRGPDDHELIVVRTGDSRLPLRPDGVTADEEALEPVTAGALEPGEPGKRSLQVHLSPGHYELICNMSGHYLGGMHTPLVVQ